MKDRIARYWSVFQRYLKPPRTLRFTTIGTYVVLLTIGVGLGAMNTGNNLIYMIFGMMLGFITASGILSEMSLRHIEIDWILPPELYAGQLATIRLILRNQKQTIPSFGLEIKTSIMPKSLSKETALDPVFIHTFICVPAQSQKYFDLKWIPGKRGEYSLKNLTIRTEFPFTFFRKSMDKELNQDLLVFPQISPVGNVLTPPADSTNNHRVSQRGLGESFWGIKEFTHGDDPRRISWKTSAKHSKLMIRETEKEIEKKVILRMEPAIFWEPLSPSELESAIAFTASFIHDQFLQGFSIGFITEEFSISPSKNRHHLIAILRYLALFDPFKKENKKDPSFSSSTKNKLDQYDPWSAGSIGVLELWKLQINPKKPVKTT